MKGVHVLYTDLIFGNKKINIGKGSSICCDALYVTVANLKLIIVIVFLR